MKTDSKCASVAIFISLALTQPLAAHLILEGSAFDVVVHRDRITVRAQVIADEIELVRTYTKTAAFNSQSQRLNWYGQYLLAHIRVRADGVALSGKLLRSSDPKKPNGRAVFDIEFRPSGGSVEPGNVEIQQIIISKDNSIEPPPAIIMYVVSFRQEGQAPQEGMPLGQNEVLPFTCGWQHDSGSGAAVTGDAPSTRPAQPKAGGAGIVGAYLRHGIMHILTGYDHLLFISALVLAAGSLWDLVKVVTVFTVAHTITLCLSALNVFHLSSGIVEPFIAASIVFVAVQNVFWPARSRGLVRLMAAFFFGLFHGLGFAGGLLEAMQGMSGTIALLAILGFSLGVEIGHQMVVLPLFGLLRVGGKWRAARPVAANWPEGLVMKYGSIAIAVAGAFYFVSALRFACLG